MKNFLKSIIVGFGGVAPGLSGSILMIIFGLYQDTLSCIGTIFKDFREKIKFLFPIISGMLVGVLFFSKILNLFLLNFEMQTRFLFFGLILGTIPIFYKEMKKKGFSKKYYFVIIFTAILCLTQLTGENNVIQIINPNFFQKIVLGLGVAVSTVVPGLDPMVVLSSMGLYEVYISALANFDLYILLPMCIGLISGIIIISYLISLLFKRFYTLTYSIIFGLFLSMIPNIFNESCYMSFDFKTIISILLIGIGYFISWFMTEPKENYFKIKDIFKFKNRL